MTDISQIKDRFENALLAMNRVESRRILMRNSTHIDPVQLIEAVIVPVMEQIGQGWHQGSVALSQVYMGGRICEELVDSLLPPKSEQRKDRLRMAIAVLEDHHVLGKRVVYSTVRASGYELLDFGHGIHADELASRVLQDGIEVLLISTLMLPSALKVKDLRRKLDAAGAKVHIIVGGAPFIFDPQLSTDVGADAMGCNASDAIHLIRSYEEAHS